MMDFGEIYLFYLGTFRLWSIAIVNHYRLVLKVLVLLVTVIVFDSNVVNKMETS